MPLLLPVDVQLLCVFYVFSLAPLVASQTSFAPSVYPLAVRSPYLNTWIKTNGDGNPARIFPTFWPTSGVNMGWSCFVQIVDGELNQTFSFMGNAPGVNASTLKSTQVTPTQTIFDFDAGSLSLTVNFLSPIEPDDWVKQSFPFSYLAVTVAPNDNKAHEVRLYCDISGEWVSSDATNGITWDSVQTSKSLIHTIQRDSPQFLGEDHSMGEDGVVYHTTALTDNMTWRTGADVNARNRFIQFGSLENTKDTNFRNINDAYPVMAHAVDLGRVSQPTVPTVWAVGKARDPAIIYKGASGQQERSSYFWSKYDTMSSAIDDFLADYSDAKKRADALDTRIKQDAGSISDNYVDLVSLATRQTLAATELTITKGSDGSWNQSDIKMFMREMGNGKTVSPVDTMYASWPAFLYLNASLAGRLLDPLLEYQSTPDYGNDFAAANLGTSYPNATGNPVVHSQSVEQSGNMLIMALSHARASGDGSLISTHYNLLKRWADFLVDHSMSLSGQTSAEGVSLGNMTNLSLKGIIGVKAMSKISAAVNQMDDQKSYSDLADSMSPLWASTSLNNDHLESLIGDASSNGIIYNLYADSLLETGIVSQQIMDVQTEFYLNRANSDPPRYGLALDSSTDLSNVTKSHWTMFAAAASSKVAARNELISMVHSRPGAVTGAFPSTYNVNTGDIIDGEASPAQGAMYAFLALNIANRSINATPLRSGANNDSNSSKSVVGAIAGGVVGFVIAIGGLISLIILGVRRRRRKEEGTNKYSSQYAPTPFEAQPTQPYSNYESEMDSAQMSRSQYPNSEESLLGSNTPAAYSGHGSVMAPRIPSRIRFVNSVHTMSETLPSYRAMSEILPSYRTTSHASNPLYELYAPYLTNSQPVPLAQGHADTPEIPGLSVGETDTHVPISSRSRVPPNPHIDPALRVGRRPPVLKTQKFRVMSYRPADSSQSETSSTRLGA